MIWHFYVIIITQKCKKVLDNITYLRYIIYVNTLCARYSLPWVPQWRQYINLSCNRSHFFLTN